MVHLTVALPPIPSADVDKLRAKFGDGTWALAQEEAAHVAAGLQ